MIHARSDYDHIQDPSGKIGKDEPVFLIRGKDGDRNHVVFRSMGSGHVSI